MLSARAWEEQGEPQHGRRHQAGDGKQGRMFSESDTARPDGRELGDQWPKTVDNGARP